MALSDVLAAAQLGLTVVLLLFSWKLLFDWRGTVRGILVQVFGGTNLLPGQLLVLGVFISFAGGLFDNLFWGIHWALDFVHHPMQGEWFSWGPTANIFFRQVPGIVAIILHLLSAAIDAQTVGNLKRHSAAYAAVGAFIIIFMLAAPHGY